MPSIPLYESKPEVSEASIGWSWEHKSPEISKEEAFLRKVNGIKSEKTREYIKRFYKTALAEYKVSGQRPSQKLAQALIESGSGTSTLAKKVNAHFGIKGGWTKSPLAKGGMRRTDDHPNEKFHGYESAWYSWRDHSYFLTMNARYKKTLTASTLEQSCYFLGTSGYATCKYRAEYRSKNGKVRKGPPGSQLLNVIKSNHLEMLDRMVDIHQ
jgi:flagellum-specific peptidoglycan hydrolase FlgJ